MAANKKKYVWESGAARFLSTAPDDLLLEILIRLPRMGPAITVCKNWHSLIISDHPKTFLRHTLHHNHRRLSGDPDPSYTPPCTLLLTYLPTESCEQVLSEKSKLLEAALSPQRSLLGFVSNLNSEAIKASFNGSLLIDLNGRYCIYNPMTREQRLLPDPPSENIAGDSRLTLVGTQEPKGVFQFRVVKFLFPKRGRTNTVMMFSSETGQWTKLVLNLRPRVVCNIVAASRALYWSDCGIVAYDPFLPANDPSSCRIIKYPSEASKARLSNSNLHMGAVRGRLRLVLMVEEEKEISIIIWELKNGTEWRVVHRVRFEKGMFTFVEAFHPFVEAFHPEDGDVIFVSSVSTLYRCELKAKRFAKVAPYSRKQPGDIFGVLVSLLHVVHLFHHSLKQF